MTKDARMITEELSNRGYKYYILYNKDAENDTECVIATNCSNIRNVIDISQLNDINIVSYKDEIYNFKHLGLEFIVKYDIHSFCKENNMIIKNEG